MMHPMGMRCVPIGTTRCFKYNLRTASWTDLPPQPIGKLWSTLISVESRYIFQIGGFDDYDFDIYQLDTQNPDADWIEIKLKEEI